MNTETQIEAKKQWLFVASAKGLQSYVFRSDPLMEMIGASELIERLPRENKASILESPPCEKKTSILKCALDEFAPAAEDYQVLTDASGTLRVLFGSKETAMRLARLWPVLAGQFAPGLEIAITVDEVADNLGEAIERAEYQINVNRNLLSADFPEAGPWVARNRRTGLPASRLVESLSSEDRGKRKEPVDGESKRKREAAEWAQSTLLRKVVPDGFELLLRNNPASRDVWPSDLTKLATSDNAYIAIIHADANGLGAAMMQCVEHLKAKTSKNAARDYSELCAAIEKSTQAAARKAMTPLLKQAKMELNPGRKAIVPVRPLVCAGEDFTCVIRAKYAVRFAHDFLCALEVETKNEFAGLSEPIHGLEKLTGCAGIVFFKSHYPFARAYAMAESLCGFAKKRTSRRASALAFLRLKNSLQPSDNYNEFIEHSFMGGPRWEEDTTDSEFYGGHSGEEGATDSEPISCGQSKWE